MQDMLPLGNLWCHRGQIWLETLSQKSSPGCGAESMLQPFVQGKDDSLE